MDLNQEFLTSLYVQLIILAFFAGIYIATIKFMGAQIKKLEEALSLNQKAMEDKIDADRKELRAALAENKRELNDKLDKDRQELKDEMRRYNNVLERMVINEQSVKAAWHSIEDIKGLMKG